MEFLLVNEELKEHFSVETSSPFPSGKLLFKIPEIIHITVPPQCPCALFIQAHVPTVLSSTPIMAFITLFYNLCSGAFTPSGLWVTVRQILCPIHLCILRSLYSDVQIWHLRNAQWINKHFTSETFSSVGALITCQRDNQTPDPQCWISKQKQRLLLLLKM